MRRWPWPAVEQRALSWSPNRRRRLYHPPFSNAAVSETCHERIAQHQGPVRLHGEQTAGHVAPRARAWLCATLCKPSPRKPKCTQELHHKAAPHQRMAHREAHRFGKSGFDSATRVVGQGRASLRCRVGLHQDRGNLGRTSTTAAACGGQSWVTTSRRQGKRTAAGLRGRGPARGSRVQVATVGQGSNMLGPGQDLGERPEGPRGSVPSRSRRARMFRRSLLHQKGEGAGRVPRASLSVKVPGRTSNRCAGVPTSPAGPRVWARSSGGSSAEPGARRVPGLAAGPWAGARHAVQLDGAAIGGELLPRGVGVGWRISTVPGLRSRLGDSGRSPRAGSRVPAGPRTPRGEPRAGSRPPPRRRGSGARSLRRGLRAARRPGSGPNLQQVSRVRGGVAGQGLAVQGDSTLRSVVLWPSDSDHPASNSQCRRESFVFIGTRHRIEFPV